MTDLELLVHTSAPSRGQDDARYRALARAYLDFTPHTHHSLSEPPQTLPTIIREIDDTSTQSHGYTKVISQDQASWVSYHPNEDDQSESALSSVSHHYQPHSQEEVPQTYTSSQLSFGSAIDNADSPPFQHRVTCNQRFLTDPQGSQEQNSSDSYHPPPSTIADSQPSYQRGLTAASSPTRMLEVYHQFIDSSQESPTAQTLLSVAHDNHASTNNQDLHLDPRSSLQELITGISSDSANQQTLPTLRSIGLRQTPSSSLESRDPSNSTSPLVQRFLRSTRKSFAMASSSPLNTENVSMVSASAPAVLQASPPQDQQTEYDLSTVTTIYGSIPSFNSGVDALVSPLSFHKDRASPPVFDIKNIVYPNFPSPSGKNANGSPIIETPYADPFVNGSNVVVPKTSTPPVVGSSLPYVSLNDTSINPGSESMIPETPALNLPTFPRSCHSDIGSYINGTPIRRATEDVLSMQNVAGRPKRLLLDTSPNSDGKLSSALAKIDTHLNSASDLPTQRSNKRQHLDLDILEQSCESILPTSSPLQELPSDMPPRSQLPVLTHRKAIYVVPATSNAHLESHMLITEGLHSLAAKMPLSTYFKPLKQTRELEEMERGHWLLKCDSWSQELRRRCWNCIGNFLIQERAGWTVGLTRNDDFGLMKVFCWSNTVPYVYLLIYIASEGKVKKIGATWMDGGSNVIITMPP